uniref:Cytochrome c oxidase subunit 2 n=1 Tax=Blattisocius tarsalis TaxID=1609195 RepID=A0A6B9WEU9_9ACAR|nr:cytochrome c oxidase subunit II [Blattisocius tarsalis]QHQ98562.1 cytochrome oxidase subunit 2 [Blattisocius tarsalis]
MPLWMETYFADANSPMMEQMIFFYDHTMIMMMSIMSFLMFFIFNSIFNSSLNFNLNNHQFMETIWTTIPMLILIFIAIPSLRLLYLMEETFNPLITIKTIGHQWYWSYEFSNMNLCFDSFMKSSTNLNTFKYLDTDFPLVIPMNCPLRLLVTSTDVIHSWTIPSLGVKTDAIPGRLNQINLSPTRAGVFFGQCSEICGMNHSFMPISLYIAPITSFTNWTKIMNS